MKKLFALVLTLALVFAVASPALAAWGDTGGSSSGGGSPYGVSVTLLQALPTVAPGGQTYYNEYTNTTGVTALTPVRFMVSFTVPTEADIKAHYGLSSVLLSGQSATITVSNIDLDSSPASGSDPRFSVNATNDTISVQALPFGSTYAGTFTGYIKNTAEAKVSASIGYKGDLGSGIVKTYNGVNYTISATGISGTSGGVSRAITFTMGSGSLITGWTLSVGGVNYTVASGPVFVNGGIAFDGKGDATQNATYATLLSAYNDMTGVLGFRYGDKVYFTPANILANFGFSQQVSASKTYSVFGGTTPTIPGSTPGGTVTVPNTGDSASVVGFMMVGLALIATAAVIVKKVRA